MFEINKDNFINAFKRHSLLSKKDPTHIVKAMEYGISWFDLKKSIPSWCGEILNALLDSSDAKDKGHITELMGEYVSGKMEIDEFCTILDTLINNTHASINTKEKDSDSAYLVLKAEKDSSKIISVMPINKDTYKEIEKTAVLAKNLGEPVPFSLKTSPLFISFEKLNPEEEVHFNLAYNKKTSPLFDSFSNLPPILKETLFKNKNNAYINYFLMVNEKGFVWLLIKTFNKSEKEVILVSDKFNIADFV